MMCGGAECVAEGLVDSVESLLSELLLKLLTAGVDESLELMPGLSEEG